MLFQVCVYKGRSISKNQPFLLGTGLPKVYVRQFHHSPYLSYQLFKWYFMGYITTYRFLIGVFEALPILITTILLIIC